MKILFLALLFVSGCSSLEVYPVRHLVDFSKENLSLEAKNSYKESGVEEYIPTQAEKNRYYSSLPESMAYRNYLLVECVLLLQKEHGLDLKRPVYASIPKWNNVQNWYASVFNFYTVVNKVSSEETIECDLAVNTKNEVKEYQLKKIYAKLNKNN